ncbi:MAG TPA: hypothetical protein VG960_06595, partial [Caulobacteraceae bacterium]|nr:hypothetical protein [Caulobacteraceae bacterium]
KADPPVSVPYAIALLLGLGLLLTASADAQTPGKPPPAAPPPVVKAVVPQSKATVIAPPPRTPDAELDLPDTDTAKRLDRKVGDQAVGGADCRTQCHTAYYMCLAADDSGGCPTAWAQCLNACPAHSSNF